MVKYKGKVVTIKYVTKKEYGIEEMGCLWTDEMFEKKEDSMTKYEELKSRIEALDNGWNKEADDILQEVKGKYTLLIEDTPSRNYSSICIFDNCSSRYVWATNGVEKVFQEEWSFKSSQCEKLEVFKKALMWLLDNSPIKNEKQNKIEALEKKMDEIKEEIRKLK